MTDKGACIAAYYANEKIHTASFAFTAHKAIGDITDEDACKYRPSREICYVFKHFFPIFDYECKLTTFSLIFEWNEGKISTYQGFLTFQHILVGGRESFYSPTLFATYPTFEPNCFDWLKIMFIFAVSISVMLKTQAVSGI